MPLLANLRHLEEDSVQLKGELPVAELDLELQDEMIRAEAPLHYDLTVEKMEGGLLIQGRLQLMLNCECVRCLKPVNYKLELKHWTAHVPLEGEEKADVVSDCVDLTPYVREDILLEFPQHPLCETNCGGLPKTNFGKQKKTARSSQSEEKSFCLDGIG